MSYYGQGDYYMGAGDPGLFSFLGKAVKGVVGGVAGSILGSSPVGAVARAATSIFRPAARAAAPAKPVIGIRQAAATPAAAASQQAQRSGAIQVAGMTADTQGFRKRRRMNVANPKALRRAIRRESGFVKLARRALKGTGYTVVSRASRGRKVNIREAGPGSVTVQR